MSRCDHAGRPMVSRRAAVTPIEVLPVGIVAAALALVPAIGPSPTLGFLLQTLGLGLAGGMLLAFIADLRRPDVKVWRITTFFSLLGLGIGLLIVAVDALIS